VGITGTAVLWKEPPEDGVGEGRQTDGERTCPTASQNHDPSGDQALGAFARIAVLV